MESMIKEYISKCEEYINRLNYENLYICGQKGAGKSVLIENLLIGEIYLSPPENIKLLIFDGKKVEFNSLVRKYDYLYDERIHFNAESFMVLLKHEIEERKKDFSACFSPLIVVVDELLELDKKFEKFKELVKDAISKKLNIRFIFATYKDYLKFNHFGDSFKKVICKVKDGKHIITDFDKTFELKNHNECSELKLDAANKL